MTNESPRPDPLAVSEGELPARPVAWRATTPVYKQFATQEQYDKFSPAAQRWYEPFRCASCAAAPQGQPAPDLAGVLEALICARDYVNAEFVSRSQIYAAYPRRWKTERDDLAKIDAAITALRAIEGGKTHG